MHSIQYNFIRFTFVASKMYNQFWKLPCTLTLLIVFVLKKLRPRLQYISSLSDEYISSTCTHSSPAFYLCHLHIYCLYDMMTSSNGKCFPRYWPFVRGIHRSPVNSQHKDQRRGALMLPLICAWINDWVNNRVAGDFRRHRGHYDVIVMIWL